MLRAEKHRLKVVWCRASKIVALEELPGLMWMIHLRRPGLKEGATYRLLSGV